jgi:hypothetical protein
MIRFRTLRNRCSLTSNEDRPLDSPLTTISHRKSSSIERGVPSEGRSERVLFGEIDDIVDMDTGLEPEHSVGSEIDILTRAVEVLGDR